MFLIFFLFIKVSLSGDEISPIKHLSLVDCMEQRSDEETILRQIVNEVSTFYFFIFFF